MKAMKAGNAPSSHAHPEQRKGMTGRNVRSAQRAQVPLSATTGLCLRPSVMFTMHLPFSDSMPGVLIVDWGEQGTALGKFRGIP